MDGAKCRCVVRGFWKHSKGAAREDKELMSPIEDAFKTMALVEACYQSSGAGGTPILRE